MDKLTNQIATGLRQGSRKAWSRLYKTYAECLWREVSRQMDGDAGEVADVVQEVFLAAAKSARRFDPDRGSLWMWLTGIARRQVALRYRRQTSRLANARKWWASLDGAGGDLLAGSGDAPADVLESKELASLVRATLLELPAHYQALLTSRYMDGQPVKRIASEAGSNAEAIRARLFRARRAFRQMFLRLAGDETDLPGGFRP